VWRNKVFLDSAIAPLEKVLYATVDNSHTEEYCQSNPPLMKERSGLRTGLLALTLGYAALGPPIDRDHSVSAPTLTPQPVTLTNERISLSCVTNGNVYAYDTMGCEYTNKMNPYLRMHLRNLTIPEEASAAFFIAGSGVSAEIEIFDREINFDMDIERIKYVINHPEGWSEHVEIPIEDASNGMFDGELFWANGLPNTIYVKNESGNIIGMRDVKEPVMQLIEDNPPFAGNDPIPPLTNR
jgi:hypothetical protein